MELLSAVTKRTRRMCEGDVAVHIVAIAQLESVRRRLLFIAAKLKICCDGAIITSDTQIKRYCKKMLLTKPLINSFDIEKNG